jgi:class 3 adenylate cyclase
VSAFPSGTVTFLFSDIEGSTALLTQLGDAWGDALGDHRRLLRDTVAEAGGREVDNQGDAFFFVFARARDATGAAAVSQRALATHGWPEDADLRVRMGLHTGEPAVGEEGYLGIDVVRAARICSAAHGRQVLVSETTRALVGGNDFLDLGLHQLKGIEGDQRLFQLLVEGVQTEFPRPRTLDVAPAVPPLPMPVDGSDADYAERALELAARIDESVRASLEESLAGVPGVDLDAVLPPRPPAPAERPQRPSGLRRLLRRGRNAG